MLEGSYGSEPFDLRLTVLRLFRNLHKILALTVAGTIIFGGAYYVKNVILRPEIQYSATSTYKVQYVEEPSQSGDYYINEMTWNTLVDTQEFLVAVQEHMAEIAEGTGQAAPQMSTEELAAAISALLPSDWHVPTTTVVTNDAEKTVLVAAAVEAAMVEELAEGAAREVASIRVMDPGTVAEEVPLDVRPARAFILSAILSFFFVTIFFMLKETGDDSIWLPTSIRRRYGIPVLGTLNGPELQQNMKYLFKGKEKIGVCSVSDEVDTAEVVASLQEKPISQEEQKKSERVSWLPMPAPVLCPESCDKLRELDGILLVVKAGSHAGKPLEYVLDFLAQQDCKVTAVLLWDADEVLLSMYYWGRKGIV